MCYLTKRYIIYIAYKFNWSCENSNCKVQYCNKDLSATELWLKWNFLLLQYCAKGEIMGSKPTLDASLTQKKKKKIQDLYSTTFHWMGLKLIHPIPVHPPLSFLFIFGKLYTHTQWVLSPQPHPPSNTCKWKSCQLN